MGPPPSWHEVPFWEAALTGCLLPHEYETLAAAMCAPVLVAVLGGLLAATMRRASVTGGCVALAFCDPRRLGRLRLRSSPETSEPWISLAPDALLEPLAAERAQLFCGEQEEVRRQPARRVGVGGVEVRADADDVEEALPEVRGRLQHAVSLGLRASTSGVRRSWVAAKSG